jgi:hypothetical protein
MLYKKKYVSCSSFPQLLKKLKKKKKKAPIIREKEIKIKFAYLHFSTILLLTSIFSTKTKHPISV